jgi:hypothetical protein
MVVLNYIYVFFFFEKDLEKHSEVIELVRAIPNDADIVYLGESSNVTFRKDDLDKRPISAFIGDQFPNLKVYDITKPASHAGIYKTLLRHIPENSQIKTVVVTLNLRSFNAQWIYSDLETPLQKSMVLLKPYPPLFNRFLLSFKAYDIKTEEERKAQIVKAWNNQTLNFPYEFPWKTTYEYNEEFSKTGIHYSDGGMDWKGTELASHYIKAYAFQIDTNNHPRIRDFEAIIRLAEKRGWNLVFNLLAENVDKAGELIGSDLLFLMDQNRDILKHYFEKRGVTVVDNLYAVRDEQFIDQDWTTEHYAEKGRKTIAANVAASIKQFHPGTYQPPDQSSIAKIEFFNDCENKLPWENNRTITTERSFSGTHSSKTGDGNDYSLAFVKPIRLLPDKMLQKVNINLMYYENSASHYSKVVVQILGQNYEGFWQGYSINTSLGAPETWKRFIKTIDLPENYKDAEIIKIYIFNPSATKVFIDDIRIEFL